ncbi:MAG: Fic family protein [Thalassolituus oleivorans]|uniref:Fic family protein n=1 Tax=Thalassolituus oleivorans TaxID=187493 RepID=UPI001B4CF51D|nr:Fic family protein [Thalassolituus oleivorans]MBQ0727602.1 Fic family protein [Thalassolituus oleivorans]MBQ0782133.1 Fic family protein [Thalassolituus oleivorans]
MLNTSLTKLDALKAKLDQYRPLDLQVVNNLHENLVLQWTYHSNAIEGNTLTLKETKVALEGITVGGKTLREHFEAINHRDAILFVDELVSKQQPLDERTIKSLHQLVLKNVDADSAGRYRDINVLISGATHKPPQAIQVPEQMQAFIHWYNTEANALHPVERAARVHGEFVKIHPFVDGNGRTARLLMNLELMKAGFPATVIEVEQRLDYYQALDNAHCSGNYTDFIALVAQCVEKSFAPYWWALGIEAKVAKHLEELGYGS